MSDPATRRAFEASAVEALAVAWNRLDPGVLAPRLADSVRYLSFETELLLEGKGHVLSYLERKMSLIEQAGDRARIRAEVGTIRTPGDPRRPCVISRQGSSAAAALFLVDVDEGGSIVRVQVVTSDPDPSSAQSSGRAPV
jgi:hypothetical protein